jgi:hypothetical protein
MNGALQEGYIAVPFESHTLPGLSENMQIQYIHVLRIAKTSNINVVRGVAFYTN